MADLDSHRTGLSIEKVKADAKFFGIASAVLLGIILAFTILLEIAFFVPLRLMQAFVLLGLVATSWQFLFYGSTAISMSLVGVARTRFQIAVAVVVPLLLSLYFIKDSTSVTLQGTVGHMFSPWFLIPLGVIASISWAVADQLDVEHPFRGFLIACAVLFIICFMGHNGIYSEYDDYTESSSTYIDEEAAKRAAETGRYFGQFLVYVAVSYVAMLIKLIRRHRSVTREGNAVVPLEPDPGANLSADQLIERTSRGVLESDEALVHAYAKVLEEASGVAVDEKRLPAPKNDIKTAIIVWLYAEQDPQTIDLLRTVYLQLARFQLGVGDVQLSINSFLKSRHLNAEDVLNLAEEDALELAQAMGPLMQKMQRWMAVVAQEEAQLMAQLERAGF